MLADRVYAPQEQIRFANSTSRIAFEFKGMSFSTKPRDMLYSWRLLGIEEAWCKPAHEMRAFYQNLELGDYPSRCIASIRI